MRILSCFGLSKLTLVCLFAVSSVATAQPIGNFNMSYVGYEQFGADLNDVWGYVDEMGNEYALVGRTNGTTVVDVTDPSNLERIFDVPGQNTVWRDIKTWNDHAYVTCECYNGLLIIDLSPLPSSTNLPYTFWLGDTLSFFSAHNLYIDEGGYAYIFGANQSNGGAIILDLNNDPMDPEPVGLFDDNYLHDGVVRGDTLWGGAVYQGEAQMIDVSDKTNPQLITSWKTPSAFTHNMWFSNDNNYLYTTDEVRNGSIAAYDVSEPLNPTLVYNWLPGDTGIIPHNTHFMDNFLITSHYTIGINIIDVSRPNNMVEVGRYDTSPDYHYQGFHGCWGAYPWLPSGNILATDIERGLYVLSADYQRGCYLEGTVTDEHTGNVIFFPQIELIEDSQSVEGSIVGEYAMGTRFPGTYTVRVSADGYYDKVIENVSLTSSVLTELDVQLSNWPVGYKEANAAFPVRVYPTPTSGELNVVAGKAIDRIELYSLDGRLLEMHSNLNTERFSTSTEHLGAGYYLLRIIAGEEVVTKQVIVQ